MKELMVSYVQHIPAGGYQLRKLQPLSLEESPTAGEGAEALCWPADQSQSQSYEPLIAEEALYCRFCDLGISPTTEEILQFANRYGWLGLGETAIEVAAVPNQRKAIGRELVTAEFVETWYQQLRLFVPFFELWNAVSANDTDYLQSVIHWNRGNSSVSYGYQHTSSVLIASKTMNAELYTTLTPGDVFPPAKVVLARTINQRLEEHCSPALLFKNASYQESHLYFRCHNLVGALWLQLARAVASHVVHRRCVECGSPFIPSRAERGKKKRFCTDACKSKNYRNRLQPKKMGQRNAAS